MYKLVARTLRTCTYSGFFVLRYSCGDLFSGFFWGGGAFLGARLTEGLETSSGGTFQCMGQARVPHRCALIPLLCVWAAGILTVTGLLQTGQGTQGP